MVETKLFSNLFQQIRFFRASSSKAGDQILLEHFIVVLPIKQ